MVVAMSAKAVGKAQKEEKKSKDADSGIAQPRATNGKAKSSVMLRRQVWRQGSNQQPKSDSVVI